MKNSICLVFFLLLATTLKSQMISPGLYSQNANLTATVGVNTNAGGKLDQYWTSVGTFSNQNYVKESNAQYFRYGGIQVEVDCEIDGAPIPTTNLGKTIQDYINKAKAIQDNGMVPMFTLPLKLGPVLTNFTLAAQQAALLVSNVNATLVATPKPGGGNYAPVRYWVYSNEPEDGGIHNYDGTNAAQIIHDYIKIYHTEVMAIWNGSWGTPEFIGPELYSFDNYNHGAGKVDRLIEQLTGNYNPIGNYSIIPYITVFSYHYYPFNNESVGTPGVPLPTRPNVVNALATGAPQYTTTNMTSTLKKDLQDLKGWLPAGFPIAITEANICHVNDVLNANGADDAITGVGANSFIAGQFWVEMLGICMEEGVKFVNLWSSIEGCDTQVGCTQPNYRTNIGYLNADPSKFGGVGGKKSTFHHFKLLSNHFWGKYYKGSFNYNGVSPTPTFTNGIKTFASVEAAGVKIVIMNQNEDDYGFRINFNNSGTGTTNSITIIYNNIQNDPLVSATFTTLTYPNPAAVPTQTVLPIKKRSTVLLTFDCHGDFVGRIDYSEQDNINNVQPQFRQIGGTNVSPDVIACGQPGIGGTINSDQTYSNTTVYVTSNINIAGNTKLSFINSTVIMSPGTKIVSTPQATLVTKGSTFFGCDGQKWKGIEMNGNSQNGLKLSVDQSAFFNADYPISADKLNNVQITRSVFGNGETAVQLSRNETFNISENLIVGYKTGISTSNTKKDFVSYIKENRIIGVEEAMKFADDGHNLLEITCNELKFRQKGIRTTNTDLMTQGTSTLSAGNDFLNISSPTQVDYIDHNGSSSSYFYGPSDAVKFVLPFISNIPTIMAAADKVCPITFSAACAPWTIGIDEVKPQLNSDLLVYPNPSSGAFNVSLPSNMKGQGTLKVHDALGRLIASQKINESQKVATFEIFARGLYLVTLESQGSLITKKVIVE